MFLYYNNNGDFMQQVIDTFVNNVVGYIQQFGIPFGCFIVMLESIVSALPLGIFIAFNMMAFGTVIGFSISWASTIFGCILAYLFFSKLVSKKLEKKLEKHPKIINLTKAIKNINFSNLVLIVALPFSPAFLINVACGISKVNFKKFICAILIGKLSIVYFWGFISKSFLESLTDFKTILMIVVILGASYILSKIINKKLKIE